MGGATFELWVGPRYKSEGLGGVKLLVLGETQYAGDPDFGEPRRPRSDEVIETRRNVIELAMKRPIQHRPFWPKVTRLILNRARSQPISEAERADLWNRIAFYNYIQWWMPRGRTKPTKAMWDDAREPFLNVLRDHSPDLILVLGRRVQANLPPTGTRMLCIPHPSSVAFKCDHWRGELHTDLELVRGSDRAV